MTKEALLVATKHKRHDWKKAVMRSCDYCGHHSMTVTVDLMATCAACCDKAYADKLKEMLERAADALEEAQTERDRFKFAFTEWHNKSEWVQKADADRFSFISLGMHRADVMTRHIECLESTLEREREKSRRIMSENHQLHSRAESAEQRVDQIEHDSQLDYVLPSELLASMEEVIRISDRDHAAWDRVKAGIAAYHTTMINAGGIQWIGFDPAKDDAPAILEGWVLVPKEPTREMVQTVADEVHPAVFVRAVYKTMIAAAPNRISDENHCHHTGN